MFDLVLFIIQKKGALVYLCFIFQIEKELEVICRDILDLLDKRLIPNASTKESKVFYFKMLVLKDRNIHVHVFT